jgi:tetratricopeptide (TPR) repeat protein
MKPKSRIVIRERIRRSHARSELVRVLRGSMEAVVLLLAAVTPWFFGGVDPVFELVIAASLAVLLVLWAAATIAAEHLTFARCPVNLVLALIFLVGLVQLVPLPSPLLTVVAPGATNIRSEIYPERPEQLTPDVQAAGAPALPTISVYPHATRAELFRWFAVVVLFAVVRNQVASTGSLWRLSLVMLVNGCLLAVFGLYQTFSKTAHDPSTGDPLVYWAYRAPGAFGPFINRGHFAAYMNLCIALGVGLLYWLGPSEQDRKQKYMVKPMAANEQREVFGWLFSPFSVLHAPAQLWALVGVGLMTASVICSLSRGGVASLFIALIAAVCLRLQWPLRFRRLEALLVPALLVLGLFAWVGFRPLETRLSSLFSGVGSAGSTRWPLWNDLMHLVPRFWLFGSGYGTLGYVEPLTRGAATFNDPAMFVEHAHNDYLEALVEGGLVRAGLTMLLLGLTFASGFFALRRYIDRTPGALAVGAMAGFLAIALHSGVDFAVTTPAVAILATIVVAHLVSLNRADPTRVAAEDHVHVNTTYLVPAARVGVAATAAVLGGILVAHAWQADRVHRLKLAAFQVVKQTGVPGHEKALDYLTAAAAIDPDDADLQSDLGQEYLDFGREQQAHEYQRLRAGALWLALGAPSKMVAAAAILARSDSLPPASRVPGQRPKNIFDDCTVPALEWFSGARKSCPLLARPEIRFATHTAELASADPPEKYWDRALYLAPFDFDLWFFAGVQQLRDGNADRAWEDWRNSLRLTPSQPTREQIQRIRNHLAAIVEAGRQEFGPDPRHIGEQLLAKVLPNRADDLFIAAKLLDPSLSATGPARPLVDRAIKLLPDRAEGLTPEQYHLKGFLLSKAGDPEAAIRAYAQALAYSPRTDWRLEYVRLLMEAGRAEEAREQLKHLPPKDRKEMELARIGRLMDARRWKEARRELMALPPDDREAPPASDWLDVVEREMIIDLPIK